MQHTRTSAIFIFDCLGGRETTSYYQDLDFQQLFIRVRVDVSTNRAAGRGNDLALECYLNVSSHFCNASSANRCRAMALAECF
jgi:hypothetical protein